MMGTAQRVEELKARILPGMRERCMILMETKIPDYTREKGIPSAMACILEIVAYEFACITVAGIEGIGKGESKA